MSSHARRAAPSATNTLPARTKCAHSRRCDASARCRAKRELPAATPSLCSLAVCCWLQRRAPGLFSVPSPGCQTTTSISCGWRRHRCGARGGAPKHTTRQQKCIASCCAARLMPPDAVVAGVRRRAACRAVWPLPRRWMAHVEGRQRRPRRASARGVTRRRARRPGEARERAPRAFVTTACQAAATRMCKRARHGADARADLSRTPPGLRWSMPLCRSRRRACATR